MRSEPAWLAAHARCRVEYRYTSDGRAEPAQLLPWCVDHSKWLE